jgi:hypothetical protein
VLTLSKRLDDESKTDESNEDDIELVEAGEDAAEPFEPPEEPLDRMALAVDGLVICHGSRRLLLGGTTGMNPKSKASCRVSLSS